MAQFEMYNAIFTQSLIQPHLLANKNNFVVFFLVLLFLTKYVFELMLVNCLCLAMFYDVTDKNVLI